MEIVSKFGDKIHQVLFKTWFNKTMDDFDKNVLAQFFVYRLPLLTSLHESTICNNGPLVRGIHQSWVVPQKTSQ